VWLKKDLYDSDAVQRLRLNVLNVIDRCAQRTFCDGYDPTRHLVRREPGVLPYNTHHWNVDIGEDVRWGAEDRYRAQDQEQNGQNNERVRAP